MKPHWALIIFAAGIGIGVLITSGGMREREEAAGNNSDAPVVTKRADRSSKNPQDSKFHIFAKELSKLSVEEKIAFRKSLAPRNRAPAIKALLGQIGPNDNSSDAKDMIKRDPQDLGP